MLIKSFSVETAKADPRTGGLAYFSDTNGK